ncbi:hypothetical protein PG994_007679 [Apiospora phragmitis]|uniref:Uncharacterized protein n=1 Tax=Apiospora phragmitis TaxID=2905665 RepID=A0ABR1UQW9_9PEZI
MALQRAASLLRDILIAVDITTPRTTTRTGTGGGSQAAGAAASTPIKSQFPPPLPPPPEIVFTPEDLPAGHRDPLTGTSLTTTLAGHELATYLRVRPKLEPLLAGLAILEALSTVRLQAGADGWGWMRLVVIVDELNYAEHPTTHDKVSRFVDVLRRICAMNDAPVIFTLSKPCDAVGVGR